MIKNGKYFVAPQQSTDNFKLVFARLAAEGAGRPVDHKGFPDGSWTPETLTQAITELEGNKAGIELRTVQVWFQDNLNGISADNIRWLARIFGCDDPELTSQWQASLSGAKDRLTMERRAKRDVERADFQQDPEQDKANTFVKSDKIDKISVAQTAVAGSKRSRNTLAEHVEWAISGARSINLIVIYWLVFCGLGFLNSILGTLSVTYNPTPELTKQVGFIWAPTLTALPLVALPLYIFFTSNLITYWRRVGRLKCISGGEGLVTPRNNEVWLTKVNDFSFSFWSILSFCVLFVWCFQVFFIYLPAYMSGDPSGVQIDRFLVTLVRPDIISIPEAIALTAIGFLYSASYIAIFMFGLLFIVIIVLDYHDICRTLELEDKTADRIQVLNEGRKIIWGSFRISLLGLWLALLLKLQVSYLSSDSTDFLTWMATDALSVFGATLLKNGWLDNTSITHFTTFLMVVVTVSVFLFSTAKTKAVFQHAQQSVENVRPGGRLEPFAMIVVIALVSATMMLVGRFDGFSLLVVASVVGSMQVLFGPKLHTFLGG